MIYEPNEEEQKMIQNLNDGYTEMVEGFRKIKGNVPKSDGEIEVHMYKISKSFESLYKRVYKLLEEHYLEEEFKRMTNTKTINKDDDNRLKDD